MTRRSLRWTLLVATLAAGATALVLAFLGWKFDMGYVWITLTALVAYITFTVSVTEWRTKFRREMNELDSSANTRAIDALLIDPNNNQPTRVAFRRREDGSMVRVGKRSGEDIE